MAPLDRTAQRRLVALALWLGGCGDGGEPAALPCEPAESRPCDCHIGTGTQNCLNDASWGECLCPVQEAVLRPDALEVTLPADGSAVVAENLLVVPRDGNGHLADLPPGTILVSFDGAGFLGRVVRVTGKGADLRIETMPAKLTDAFEELKVKLQTPVNVYGGLPKEARDKILVPQAGFSADGFAGASLSGEGSIDIGVSFGPESTVYFQPNVDFELAFSVSLDPIDEIRFVASLDAGLHLVTLTEITLDGSLAAELDLVEFIMTQLGYPELAPLRVPIAAGFEGEVYLYLGCELSASGTAEFTTEFDASLSAGGGIDWNDAENKFETVSWSEKSFDSDFRDFDFTASAGLECYVRPRLALAFLRTARVYVQSGPYVGTEVEIGKGANNLNISAGLRGEVGASLELDFDVITISLFDETYTLFDLSWDIFNWEFNICGDGYQQLEEECDPGPNYRSHPSAASCDTSTCTCNAGWKPGTSAGTTDDSGRWGSTTNWCVPACGDGVLDPVEGEICDEGGQNGTCGHCTRDCGRTLGDCGDMITDTQCGERCDDGNANDCDACPNSCSFVNGGCGDGITNWNCGESCDDGNVLDGDTCSSLCQRSLYCGDGVVGTFEECDDGNANDCDACAWCRTYPAANVCGDGRVCGVEQCDEGGVDAYNCDADCTWRACGDGHVNAAALEACDDSGVSATCDADCTTVTCGDGTVNAPAGEACDSGGVDTWSCDSDCTIAQCGDGYFNAAREICDDGNTDDCDATCNSWCGGPGFNAVCGDGVRHFTCGEACDDGAQNGACDACAADCSGQDRYCGDGAIDGACGEVCDDGNTGSGDGCRGDCLGNEQCGDTRLDVGEMCDDGNTAPCQGPCDETCSGLYPDVCDGVAITGCETCEDSDPGNTTVDMGCTVGAPNCAGCRRCSPDVCGDGVVGNTELCERQGTCADANEQPCQVDDLSLCDVGTTLCNLIFGEGYCEATCQRLQTCGDGFIDGSESCDDGPGQIPPVGGDGCSSICTVE